MLIIHMCDKIYVFMLSRLIYLFSLLLLPTSLLLTFKKKKHLVHISLSYMRLENILM